MRSIICENQTSQIVNLDFLETILKNLSNKKIELIICQSNYIQSINKQFRDKDTSTDVLSFPYEDMPNAPLGSIVINIDLVKEKAKLYNHSFDDELALLFIHGVLHTLGYDHEVDNGEHRKKEEELIKKFNLPQSLIVRNS